MGWLRGRRAREAAGVGTWGGVGEPGRGVERSYGISCVFVFGDGVGLVVVYDGVCGL